MPRRQQPIRHQPFQPKDNCAAKRRFPTEKQAVSAADTQMLVQPNVELHVYECPNCGGWHLTRTKRLV